MTDEEFFKEITTDLDSKVSGLDWPTQKQIEEMSKYFECKGREKGVRLGENSSDTSREAANPFEHFSVFNPSLTGLCLAAKALDVSMTAVSATLAIYNRLAVLLNTGLFGLDVDNCPKIDALMRDASRVHLTRDDIGSFSNDKDVNEGEADATHLVKCSVSVS